MIGKRVPAEFIKTPAIHNGLIAVIPKATEELSVLFNLTTGLLFDSVRIGRTSELNESVLVKLGSKAALMASRKDSLSNSEKEMNSLKNSIKKNIAPQILDSLPANAVYADIPKKTISSRSFIYRVFNPGRNSTLHQTSYANIDFKLYAMNGGLFQELRSKLVDRNGVMFTYLVDDLEPGTLYSSLAYSYDGGETLIPSSTISVITKNLEGKKVNYDDALLMPVKTPLEGFELLSFAASVELIGWENLNR